MPQITVRGPSGPPLSYRFDRDPIVIGRSSACHLVVRDEAISRKHVEIRREGGGWRVEDCGSRNGTYLNGRPVLKPAPLEPGDEIAIGDTVLVFEGKVTGSVSAGDERLTEPLEWSGRGTGSGEGEPVLIGRSPAVRDLLDRIDRIAPSTATVLITGENGTGKELAARLIHLRSKRASGPFMVVNCPALPGSLLESELFGVEKGVATGVEPRIGRFEAADGGTLLLDEIGDMDQTAQAKILRVLEERKVERLGGRKPVAVDVRILAATNHDLKADIEEGTFRRDLYHRLNTVTLTLPPLRERREDILLLAGHFLADSARPHLELSREATALIEGYDFPGNVRELEHVIERAVLLAEGTTIEPRDLPEELREETRSTGETTGPSEETVDLLFERIVRDGESFWEVVRGPYLRREISPEAVRRFIERAHREAGGSYKEMARLLHIETDYRKLLNFLYQHKLRVKK